MEWTEKDSRGVLSFLRRELVRRRSKNPRFSLRRMAQIVDLEPSFLSKILRGERRLTPSVAKQVCEKLGVSAGKMENGGAMSPWHPLSLEIFELISQWQYWVLLELVLTEGFDGSVESIAKAFQMGKAEARSMRDRLLQFNLLKEDEGTKRLVPCHDGNTTVHLGMTNTALKSLQRQFLQLAMDAMDRVPLERRDQSTLTVACHESQIPEVKTRIREFRREMRELMSQTKCRKNVVMNLVVAYYPVASPGPKPQKGEDAL